MADYQQNASAPTFMGEFCHAIDGKNRITIPSEWRTSEADQLFLMPGTASHCLRILPRGVLDDIRAKAADLPGAERTVALRRIGSQSRQVAIDKHGRLSLPEEFCQQLKLSGNVTLVGVVETFEIWNSDEWKAAQSAQQAAADATLAALGL
jgi:MraZ protein